MIELLGWAGSILLTVCGLPQLVKTYRSKTIDGLSFSMLLSWHLGCLFTMVYIYHTAFKWPLLCNYFFNVIITGWLLVLYCMYKKK